MSGQSYNTRTSHIRISMNNDEPYDIFGLRRGVSVLLYLIEIMNNDSRLAPLIYGNVALISWLLYTS